MSLFYRAVLGVALISLLCGQVFADSITIEGPGMKVQNKNGWFGRKNTSYQDALGNRLEQNKNIFGYKTTRTRVFGSEAIHTPRQTTVTDSQGNTMVSTRKTWFHGKQTQINGNAMINSFKGLFQP